MTSCETSASLSFKILQSGESLQLWPNGISANANKVFMSVFLFKKFYGYFYARFRLFITEVKRLCSL